MPMRGLSSFVALRGRSCLALTGELATVPRSAGGGGVTLGGRLDAAAASTKACAGGEIGLSRIPKTAVLDPFSGSAGKSLVTPVACTVGDAGLSWITKAVSSSNISPFGVRSLHSKSPATMSSIRCFYTQQTCTVGDAGLSWITKAVSSGRISPFGVRSLHSKSPATLSSIRCFYTQQVGGPTNRDGSVVRFICGLVVLCGGLFILSFGSEFDATPVEPVDMILEPGIDWVKLGCTPPVVPAHINKGCGCCYAIVSVQNLESVMQIETGKSPRMSIQEVIDCLGEDKYGKLYGCKGGFMSVAFEYMKMNGLASDLDYPINLIQRQAPCQAADKRRTVQPADKPKPGAVQVIDWEQFKGQDDYTDRLRMVPPVPVEDQFKAALLKSPISVRIYANKFFANYDGKAIIEYHQCPPPPKGVGHNHSVLLVGFGTDDLGNKFWLIQNVWGVLWGRNGYALLRRGGSDPRGVGGITAGFACRPIVKVSS